MSVQSKTVRFELDLIVQNTVDILKNGDSSRTLTSDTILRPGSNNLSVRVRVGVRFSYKLLFNLERQLAEETKKNSLSV